MANFVLLCVVLIAAVFGPFSVIVVSLLENRWRDDDNAPGKSAWAQFFRQDSTAEFWLAWLWFIWELEILAQYWPWFLQQALAGYLGYSLVICWLLHRGAVLWKKQWRLSGYRGLAVAILPLLVCFIWTAAQSEWFVKLRMRLHEAEFQHAVEGLNPDGTVVLDGVSYNQVTEEPGVVRFYVTNVGIFSCDGGLFHRSKDARMKMHEGTETLLLQNSDGYWSRFEECD